MSADKTTADTTDPAPGKDQPTTVMPAAPETPAETPPGAETPPAEATPETSARAETPAAEATPETSARAETPPAEATAVASPVVTEPPADQGPGFRERARMRRRLRYLRRLRELLFRDLGGLTFDLHRFGRERTDLVEEKLAALTSVDAELRTLETALDDRRQLHELREAGISACPRCGTLHDTDANFCPACGSSLHGKAPAPPVSEMATEAESHQTGS